MKKGGQNEVCISDPSHMTSVNGILPLLCTNNTTTNKDIVFVKIVMLCIRYYFVFWHYKRHPVDHESMISLILHVLGKRVLHDVGLSERNKLMAQGRNQTVNDSGWMRRRSCLHSFEQTIVWNKNTPL